MNQETEKAVRATSAVLENTGESRQVIRRRLFTANFAAYPGFVMGNEGRVSAHSKMGGFVPRAERRKLAEAFAAGKWRKRNVVALVP